MRVIPDPSAAAASAFRITCDMLSTVVAAIARLTVPTIAALAIQDNPEYRSATTVIAATNSGSAAAAVGRDRTATRCRQ